MLYHMNWDRIQKVVDELKPVGLMAIEAAYTTNSPAEERQTREFAERNGLLVSGGSDYHGEAKPLTDLGMGMGNLYVSYDLWPKMHEAQILRYGDRGTGRGGEKR